MRAKEQARIQQLEAHRGSSERKGIEVQTAEEKEQEAESVLRNFAGEGSAGTLLKLRKAEKGCAEKEPMVKIRWRASDDEDEEDEDYVGLQAPRMRRSRQQMRSLKEMKNGMIDDVVEEDG